MKEYNFNKIFVSKIIESRFPFKIKNPLLASIIKFGLIPNLFFIIFYLMRYEFITSQFLIAYIFTFLWLNIGPYLIWHYDNKLLPKFFLKISDIIPDQEKIYNLAKKYNNLASKKFWLITAPWTILILFIYMNSLDIFLQKGGIFGPADFFYWILFIIVIWIGILTGIGFWGVLIALFAVGDISKENLKINPLHSDNLGGLSPIGYYAIGTTLLFSSGSLFLPIAFQIIGTNRSIPSYIDFAVLLFSTFVLISFLYPTIKIHNRAKAIRDSILNDLIKRYIDLHNQIDVKNKKSNKMLTNFIEFYTLRNELLDYKRVKLYPLEVDIFIKLITSLILPFIFLVIQVYWFSILNII